MLSWVFEKVKSPYTMFTFKQLNAQSSIWFEFVPNVHDKLTHNFNCLKV